MIEFTKQFSPQRRIVTGLLSNRLHPDLVFCIVWAKVLNEVVHIKMRTSSHFILQCTLSIFSSRVVKWLSGMFWAGSLTERVSSCLSVFEHGYLKHYGQVFSCLP